MIVESKGGQLFFFFLGVALCASGIYGFVNINDIMFNFCRSITGSLFFNVLNDILTYVSIALTFALGLLLIWFVFHSVVECRKFKGEGAPFDWKKFIATIRAYIIMIGAIAILVILLNQYINVITGGGGIVQQKTYDYSAPEVESVTRMSCSGIIVTYRKKESYESSSKFRGIVGFATIKLTEPKSMKGKFLTLWVVDDDNKTIWSRIGANVRFFESKKVLHSGKHINSDTIHLLP
jgi:hypothetical protein